MSRHFKYNLCFFVFAIVLFIFRNEISNAWIYASALTLVYLFGISIGVFDMSKAFFLKSLCNGNMEGKNIALTFDDGPVEKHTERVLDILQKHQVPAAFFCIGRNAHELPRLVVRMHHEGHIVAIHSQFHSPSFTIKSTSAVEREIDNTNRIIEQIISKKPRFFRPPYGITNPMIASALKRTGVLSIGWSVRSFDTISSNQHRLFRRITHQLKGGDIVLLHDRCPITGDILDEFITHVRKNGFNIVSLDKILSERPYE